MKKIGDDLHFSVTGEVAFPTDMLRYDECRFASEPAREAAESAGKDHYEIEIVDLIMEKSGDRMPSFERWKSMGWHVVGMVADHPETDRRSVIWSELLASLSPEQKAALDYYRPERVI